MKVGRLREHAHVLGFTPQEQVRWLSPQQLVRTAVKVAVSSLFADYADRREVQAALGAEIVDVPRSGDGLWLDFVADTGDGFDPTFTIAWLLARPELEVGGHRLPRGDVLVLGGDEAYPTPSAAAYEDRTTGPFRAALPTVDAGRAPIVLAVPGNHDWYDGLTAFLRIFTQRRRIGGWRTRQTRSYFVARLPGNWWLVGLDTQLGQYIDGPQISYFREHLSRHLSEGAGVIVCAPTPTWVTAAIDDPDHFNSLHYFERQVVERCADPATGESRPTGAKVRVWISGDQHHYSRYAEDHGAAPDGTPRQLFTCGLGGAYLMGTGHLPEAIEVPPSASRMSGRERPSRFRRDACWPTPADSRRLALGVLSPGPHGIVGRNRGLSRFVGLAHAFLLPVLAFLLGVEQRRSPGDVLRHGAPSDVVMLAVQLAVWIGAAVALACLIPLLRLRRPHRPPGWLAVVASQLAIGLAALAAALAVPWPDWSGWQVTGLAALGVFAVAGWAGSYALAAYFLLSPERTVRDLALSARSIEDGKGFLRLHLADDGRLTIYPLLVERVCHDWEVVEAGRAAEGSRRRVRPVPAAGHEPVVRLIEDPVVVVRRPGPG